MNVGQAFRATALSRIAAQPAHTALAEELSVATAIFVPLRIGERNIADHFKLPGVRPVLPGKTRIGSVFLPSFEALGLVVIFVLPGSRHGCRTR